MPRAEGGTAPISRRGWLGRLGRLALGTALGLHAWPRSARSSPGTRAALRPGALEPWDERFEFVVSFQFGDERTGNVRRPYLVGYIEDPQGALVRTIVLWSQTNEAWVRSLTRWYRADRARRGGTTDLPSTVTGATRPPGHYTIVWDGRDDDGALVEQGEYALVLESVRQNSRAFFLRQTFEFGTTPFTAEVPALGSFSQVSVEFRERS